MQKFSIKDNGSGIQYEDFPLLCSRYATSKIRSLSDLSLVKSYGFRGEALASLTHVSEVMVLSRHKDQHIGYEAKFKDERMVMPEPIEVKGGICQIGTTITAQNLFMGALESRRKSQSAGEEKRLIK